MSNKPANQEVASIDSEQEPAERRYDPRTRLVQIGKLQTRDERMDCFIVDLSRKGTKIRTLEPISSDISNVKLHIADIGAFEAEVRWVDGLEIGLRLNGEIEAPEEYDSADFEDVLRLQNG